jgi:hypothetical protein
LERGYEGGDRLVALAQAYEVSGARIFGVGYQWVVNGVRSPSTGTCIDISSCSASASLLGARTR